jgi:histidinol-phosphate/aromatic aminotransferase/cobyric acid decarboxylase-like protein
MPVSRIREIMELAWGDPEAIHLEVGEPDFPTPEHVVEAAHRAARAGLTRYAPNAGLPVLREALSEKVARRNGYGTRPEQVVVTQGGIQALYLALRALLEPGDDVLLPDPAWPNYRMIAHLLGARVLSYPLVAGGGFLPRLEDLERLVTPAAPREDLRRLPAPARQDRVSRHGHRARRLQEDHGAPRRQDLGRVRTRRRQHVLLHPASPERDTTMRDSF